MGRLLEGRQHSVPCFRASDIAGQHISPLNLGEAEDDSPIENIEHILWKYNSHHGRNEIKRADMGFADEATEHPEIVDDGRLQRQQSIWGRHTGLYDGTSDYTFDGLEAFVASLCHMSTRPSKFCVVLQKDSKNSSHAVLSTRTRSLIT